MPYRDDDYDTLDPREFPDAGADDPAPLPCPHCLSVLTEDHERCPHCGNWLSEEDAFYRKPIWIVLSALLCLALAIGWIVLG